MLQNRRKWAVEQRNLKVGDVVLLVDRQTPRDQWPLGVIIETFKGEDQLVGHPGLSRGSRGSARGNP